jgi:hypothetical protein
MAENHLERFGTVENVREYECNTLFANFSTRMPSGSRQELASNKDGILPETEGKPELYLQLLSYIEKPKLSSAVARMQ